MATPTTAARTVDRPETGARENLLELMPLTEQRLRLAGIPTAVLTGGLSKPLVLLHGPGEHTTKWFRIDLELVKSRTVIAPDLPGHGASGAGDGELDAGKVLDWVDHLIGQTCREPPVHVGQINGGGIAARYAALHSDWISRLVLSEMLGLELFNPAPEFGRALQGFLGQPDTATRDGLWQYCAQNLARLRGELGEKWALLKAYDLDRAAAGELRQPQMALMQQFGFPAIEPEKLKRITMPTTLIWGRNDLASPLSFAADAAKRYGWALRVIDDCGDDPPIEQPEAFVPALGAGS